MMGAGVIPTLFVQKVCTLFGQNIIVPLRYLQIYHKGGLLVQTSQFLITRSHYTFTLKFIVDYNIMSKGLMLRYTSDDRQPTVSVILSASFNNNKL